MIDSQLHGDLSLIFDGLSNKHAGESMNIIPLDRNRWVNYLIQQPQNQGKFPYIEAVLDEVGVHHHKHLYKKTLNLSSGNLT